MNAKQVREAMSMKTVRRVSCALVVAAMAAGCSQTTRYYALSPVDPVTPPARRTGAVVAVGSVDLPDYADRPQIVVRTGPNTLDQAEFDQWGGALSDMVPRLLAEDLARRLPGDHIVDFPAAGDVPYDVRVPIEISQFDVSASGEAVVAARWQVRGKPGSGLVTVHESVTRARAVGSSYDQRVDALSRALADLASDIAEAVAEMPNGGTVGSKAAH